MSSSWKRGFAFAIAGAVQLQSTFASLPDLEVAAHHVKLWNLVGPCHVDSSIPGQEEVECAYITNPLLSAAISASCTKTHIIWEGLGGCPNIASVSSHTSARLCFVIYFYCLTTHRQSSFLLRMWTSTSLVNHWEVICLRLCCRLLGSQRQWFLISKLLPGDCRSCFLMRSSTIVLSFPFLTSRSQGKYEHQRN